MLDLLDLLVQQSPQAELVLADLEVVLRLLPRALAALPVGPLGQQQLFLGDHQLGAVHVEQVVPLADRHARVVHVKPVEPPGNPGGAVDQPRLVVVDLAHHAHQVGDRPAADRRHLDAGQGRGRPRHLHLVRERAFLGHGDQVHEADGAFARLGQLDLRVHRAGPRGRRRRRSRRRPRRWPRRAGAPPGIRPPPRGPPCPGRPRRSAARPSNAVLGRRTWAVWAGSSPLRRLDVGMFFSTHGTTSLWSAAIHRRFCQTFRSAKPPRAQRNAAPTNLAGVSESGDESPHSKARSSPRGAACLEPIAGQNPLGDQNRRCPKRIGMGHKGPGESAGGPTSAANGQSVQRERGQNGGRRGEAQPRARGRRVRRRRTVGRRRLHLPAVGAFARPGRVLGRVAAVRRAMRAGRGRLVAPGGGTAERSRCSRRRRTTCGMPERTTATQAAMFNRPYMQTPDGDRETH